MRAGALERNLIPVKAQRQLSLDEIRGEPVRVHAAGIAFPHPDKVWRAPVARGVGGGGLAKPSTPCIGVRASTRCEQLLAGNALWATGHSARFVAGWLAHPIRTPRRLQVKGGGTRGVNHKHYGDAGEDAYFYCSGR